MKILVIHASAGAGHLKAAEAIYSDLRAATKHQAVLVDALDHSSFLFKHGYKETYFFLISRIPAVWGFFFWLLDLPALQPVIRFLRRVQNRLNTAGLHRYLQEQQFDYIFMTHFMPTEVAAALKRRGKIRSKLVTVITDFDVHKIWLADGIDAYTVASDWTKGKLEELGIPAGRIHVTGIPTHAKFAAHPDIKALKQELGLKEDLFTVLLATGSFGIGPIEAMIDELEGFQIIVVCGHNKDLYGRLNAKHRELVHVMGLVDNMHELMAVADVMVTKPGGLSISEALVSQLPLVFFSAIPGQETGNIEVLKMYGLGISGCGIAEIGERLRKMRASKDEFLTTLKRTKALAHPTAAHDITSLIK